MNTLMRETKRESVTDGETDEKSDMEMERV